MKTTKWIQRRWKGRKTLGEPLNKPELPWMDTINGVVRVWDEKSQKWIPDCYPIQMPEIIDSLRGLEQSMRTALVRATPLDRQERDQAMLRETVYQSMQSLHSLLKRLDRFNQMMDQA